MYSCWFGADILVKTALAWLYCSVAVVLYLYYIKLSPHGPIFPVVIFYEWHCAMAVIQAAPLLLNNSQHSGQAAAVGIVTTTVRNQAGMLRLVDGACVFLYKSGC